MRKLNGKIICGGCGRKTRKVGAVLRDKKDNRIIGYLCDYKCTKRATEVVRNRPVGTGWRQALRMAVAKTGPLQKLSAELIK